MMVGSGGRARGQAPRGRISDLRRPTSDVRGKRGSILLMVLVLVIIVSFTLTKFIAKAQVEVQSEGYFVQRADLRLQAWSAMEVAVAVLADVKLIDGALFSPSQGWTDPVSYAGVVWPEGVEVEYEFIDESAKFSMNEMDEDLLAILFQEMDFDLLDAQEMASVFLDWTDEDDNIRIGGAESREYSSTDFDMHPTNGPIQSMNELKSMIGFRDQFFDENGVATAQFETLNRVLTHMNVTRFNVNSADPLTMKALGGFTDLQIDALDRFIGGLDGVKGTEDDEYITSAEELSQIVGEILEGSVVTNQISILTIKVTVREGDASFSLTGTIDTQAQAAGAGPDGQSQLQYPFLFLELKEEPSMNNSRPS